VLDLVDRLCVTFGCNMVDNDTYLLAVLKPNRIIGKHTDANYSSFHL
jgi:hypothetical protein